MDFQGEKVVTRFTVHSTHDRGEIMGLAPTGRQMTNRVILIHRICEGKIAEEWGIGTIGSNLRGQLLEQERIERERVEEELRVAQRIQHASLPKEVPTLEGWQISPFYKPAREVGGDFYDFHLLSGDQLGLVVGDATGKGVPAALVMSTTCGMLQAVSQTLDSSSPGDVLSRVNETLLPLSTRARMPERKGGRRHLMAAEDEVRQASEQFYAALNSTLDGDSSPMEEIWSHGSEVSATHPFGGRVLGWEEVRASWEQAAQEFSGGHVELEDMVVIPISEDAAYTLGTEHGQGRVGDQTLGVDWRVTNIYRREAEGWKMVHHHTDFSSEVAEALGMWEGRVGQ
jgi:ketosteroid isomerase-like protein